ncbi:MAG TPA: metal ABC transporter permease [Tepidisphaeraceae bacterium]|nr:metal ABC transporter permease [Tepidisphaeraceae bacterium]
MLSPIGSIFTPLAPSELSTFWPILLQGGMVAVALGLIGCFLVVRGLSLLGDALSHAVLPGIVIGFLVAARFGEASLHSPWILVGASAVGLLAAALVQAVHGQSRVKEDASLGIVFTTLFAAGVVMINVYAGQADLDPNCVLYGNIEYFVLHALDGPGAFVPMACILAGILAALVVFYRPLLITTFDPALAVSMGISAAAVHYVTMGVLSLTVVASFEAVGAILAVALLVMPGATARLWTDRLPVMLLLAAAHGLLATALGYWLSHEAVLNTSAAGAICTAGFALFLASWLASPHRGLVTRWVARRRMNETIATENLLKTIMEFGGTVDDRGLAEATRTAPRKQAAAIKRGVVKGWVITGASGHSLTDAGRARAHRLQHAHELWEQYLRDHVGLPADHVHDAAEWIEHHLSDESVETIGAELGGAGAVRQ